MTKVWLIKVRLALIIGALIIVNQGFTQNFDNRLSVIFEDVSYERILEDLKIRTSIPIYYRVGALPNENVNFRINNKELEEGLKDLFLGTGLRPIRYKNAIFIVAGSADMTRDILGDAISKSQVLADISGRVIKLDGTPSQSNRSSLTIKIIDKDDKEELIGAAISVNGKLVAATDLDGTTVLALDKGMNAVSISTIGYAPLDLFFDLSGDAQYTVRMEKESQFLDEFVVTGTGVNTTRETQSGINRIDVQSLERIPTFLGERDVVKAVMLNPGVSSIGEGAAGFNVRGGNVDQNLVMQDDAILFNSSHALGFFSTFNADMIKTATLHKGAINSQFGGRLASVLEVQTKDAVDRLRFKLNVNVLSATATAEVPISDKISFIGSGRTTYSNFIFTIMPRQEIKNSTAGFYDLNGKLNFKLGNTTVSLSGYYSADDFSYNKSFGFDYYTKIAQATVRTLINSNLTNRLSFVWSDYLSNQNEFTGQLASTFRTQIGYIRAHDKLTFKIGEIVGDVGVSSTIYDVAPGEFLPFTSESLRLPSSLEREKGIENSAYVSVEIPVGDLLDVVVGGRLNHFVTQGPKTVHRYRDDVISKQNIVGTEVIEGKVRSFFNPELRTSLKFNINDNSTLKVGYGRTSQYLNQIFNTDVPSPSSQWQMVNNFFEPGIADNFSAGVFFGSDNNDLEFSVEAFKRNMLNVYDYKDFADLFVNPHVETELLQGKGDSRGLEVSMKKNKGVLNGFVSYTFSQTTYTIDGINNGSPYFANYDQPHNVSMILNYQPIEKITYTANFTYRTGRPTTAPVTSYVNFDRVYVPIYSDRNDLRIPDTHRLDLSANFGRTHNRASRIKTSWTFTIYNVYNRRNPFSVFYTRSARDVPTPQANRLAIVGTIFPSLAFNIEFQ